MSSAAQKRALLRLPGDRKHPAKKRDRAVDLLGRGATARTRLLPAEAVTLVLKKKDGLACIDLNDPASFQLPNSQFLRDLPDVVKELDASNNLLTEFTNGQHLSKLKRLLLNNNPIVDMSFKGLKSCVEIALHNCRIEHLSDMTDLQKLVNLDLSGNRLTTGFAELAKAKLLSVLDLGDCSISLSTAEFYSFLLIHLKKLTNLEFINFAGNPIATAIPHFRYLIIHELPRLKYLNYDEILKDDRQLAADLAAKNTWGDKLKPIDAVIPRASAQKFDDPLAALDDILNFDSPAPVATNPGAGGQSDVDYLDMLNDMLDSDATAVGPNSSANAQALAIEDLMKDLDLDFDAPVASTPAAKPPAPSSSNDMDYLDMLNGMIDSPTPAAAPKPAPAPSSSSDTDFLDMLDDMLGETPAPAATPKPAIAHQPAAPKAPAPAPAPAKAPAASASDLALDELLMSIGYDPAVEVAKPKPAPTPAAQAPNPEAVDDYLSMLDDIAGPTPPKASSTSSFDELEATIGSLEVDFKASNSNPSVTTPAAAPAPAATADFDFDFFESELNAIGLQAPAPTVTATPAASAKQPAASPAKQPIAGAKGPLKGPGASKKMGGAPGKAGVKVAPAQPKAPAEGSVETPAGTEGGASGGVAKKFGLKPATQRAPSASVASPQPALTGETPGGRPLPPGGAKQPIAATTKADPSAAKANPLQNRSQSTSVMTGMHAKLAGVVGGAPPKIGTGAPSPQPEGEQPGAAPKKAAPKAGFKMPSAAGISLKSTPSKEILPGKAGAAKTPAAAPKAATPAPEPAAPEPAAPVAAEPTPTMITFRPPATQPAAAPESAPALVTFVPGALVSQPPAPAPAPAPVQPEPTVDDLDFSVLDELESLIGAPPVVAPTPAAQLAPAQPTPAAVQPPPEPAFTAPPPEPEPAFTAPPPEPAFTAPPPEPAQPAFTAPPPEPAFTAPPPEPEPAFTAPPPEPTPVVKAPEPEPAFTAPPPEPEPAPVVKAPEPEPAPVVKAHEPEPAPVVKAPEPEPTPVQPAAPRVNAAALLGDDDDFDAVLEKMMAKKATPAAATPPPAAAQPASPPQTKAPEPKTPPKQSEPVAEPVAPEVAPNPAVKNLQRGGRKASFKGPTKRDPWNADIDAIHLEAALAKGSFGNTFEGYWRSDPEKPDNVIHCTVKRFKPSDMAPETVDAFQNEVKNLMALDHKNLVKVVGGGVSDAKHVLWEWIDGNTAWGYLRNAGGAPVAQWALLVAREVAAALEYLHEQGVIHGLLKSKNVLLDKEMTARVKDFGFLDVKDALAPDETETVYLAPELLNGEAYNEKVDVYSFAMLMLELLSGKTPFQGLSAAQIVDKARPDIPVALPPVFERLIRACWTTDPERRPTFSKIRTILAMPDEKLLGGVPGETAPPPQAEPEPDNSSFATAVSPALPDAQGVERTYISRPLAPEKVEISAEPMVKAAPLPAAAPAKPQAPPKEKIKVAKPKALMLRQEGGGLDAEQERKLSVVVAKVSEMVNSGQAANQIKAIGVLLDIVKDEQRVQYVAKKTKIVRELVEIITDTDPNLRPASFGGMGPYEAVEAILRAFSQLATTHYSMIKALSDARIVPCLVDLLSRDNEALNIMAAKVLTELATDSGMREVIRAAGGLYPMVNMLRSQNEFVQVQAAWTLSELLDDEQSQNDFILTGGLRLLVDKLTSGNAGLKLRALDAMSNFYTNDKAREAVVAAGLKEKFMGMLSAPNALLKNTAIRGIVKFSRTSTFLADETEAIRVLNALIVALSNQQTTPRERMLVIQTIANITKTLEYLIQFRDLGGLSLLVRNMTAEKDDEVKFSILQILFSAFGDEKSREAVVALGGVTPIVLQLQSYEPKLRQMALKALLLLSEFPKGLSTIFATGAVTRLISIVSFSPERTDLIYALKLLVQLARTDEYKGELRDAGAIGSLLERLRDLDNQIVPRLASVVLANLCTDATNRDVLIQENGLVKWVGYVKDAAREAKANDPDAAEMIGLCLMAVTNFVQDEATWVHLRDAGAPEMVCFSLAHPDPAVLTKALRCLLSLLKDPRNKRVVQTQAIQRLKDLETHQHPNVPKAAAAVLDNLQQQLASS